MNVNYQAGTKRDVLAGGLARCALLSIDAGVGFKSP